MARPGRGQLVGEAYILMRADGRLLKRDMQSEARAAGKAAGDEGAESWRKSWDDELDGFERDTATRLRRSFAKMTAEADFSSFTKQFRSSDEAAKALALTLDRMSKEGMSDVQITKVNKAWEAYNRELDTSEKETRRYRREVRDLKVQMLEFGGALDSIRQRKIKSFGSDLASAFEAKNFARFIDTTKDIDRQVVRLQVSIMKHRKALGLTDLEYRNLITSMQAWARRTKDQNDLLDKQSREAGYLDNVLSKLANETVEEMIQQLARATHAGDFSRLRREGESLDETWHRLHQTMYDNRVQINLTQDSLDRVRSRYEDWAEGVEIVDDRIRRLTTSQRKARIESERNNSELRKLAQTFDGLSVTVGKISGKGSRNNFFNFVGSALGGLAKVVTVFPLRVMDSLTKGFSTMSSTFKLASADSGGGLGGLTAGLRAVMGLLGKGGGAGGAVTGIVTGFAAAAAAVFAFGKVLPAIASAVVLLSGALVGLVGTLSVAVVGALLTVAPAGVAAAAGFGFFATAVSKWSNSKDGKAAVKQFNAELEKTAKTLMPQVGETSKRVLGGITTLMKELAPGMNRVLENFNKQLSDPKTQSSLKAWSKSLGVMTEDIGNALSNLTIGLINFFEPILPYAERFTGWLEDVTGKFAAWTQTTEGKNSIRDFMDVAFEAAKDLGRIISETGEIIGKVFFRATESEGGTWLDKIADKLAEINAWLDKPENKDILNQWFKDSSEFAKDLIDVAKGIGEIIKELDTEKSREDILGFVDALGQIGKAAKGIGEVAAALGLIWDVMTTPTPKILTDIFGDSAGKTNLQWLKDTADSYNELSVKVNEWLTASVAAIGTWVSESAAAVGDWVSGTAQSFTDWGDSVGTGITDGLTSVGESISTWFSETQTSISTWASEMWQGAIESIRQGAIDSMDAMTQWLTDFATALEGFDLTTWLTGITDSIGTWAAEALLSFQTWVENVRAELETFFTVTIPWVFEEGFSQLRTSIATWAQETWDSFITWGQNAGTAITGFFTQAGADAQAGFASMTASVQTWSSETNASISTWVSNAMSSIGRFVSESVAAFGRWASETYAAVQRGISQVGADLAALPGRVSAWLAGLPNAMTQPFRTAWTSVNATFDGAPGRLAAAAARVVAAIGGALGNVFSTITAPFRRAWDEVSRIISSLPKLPSLPKMGRGGILYGATPIIAGEAGTEAIVPLNRSLSQVDPSVRWLSAIAQGKATSPAQVSETKSSSVVFEEGAVQVVTRAQSPAIIQTMLMDNLAEALERV